MQRLYRDAVHSVWAFLGLVDLAAAVSCCRSWHSFGASLPGGGWLTFEWNADHGEHYLLQSAKRVKKLAASASPLRGRVSSLAFRSYITAPIEATCTLVADLSSCFPALVSVFLDLSGRARYSDNLYALEAPLFVSATLTNLDIIASGELRDKWLSESINAAGHCPHLSSLAVRRNLTKMEWTLPSNMSPGLDLAPLERLESLTNLSLGFDLTANQCDVIKRLARLQFLVVEGDQRFSRIASTPHALSQLRILDSRNTFVFSRPASLDVGDMRALATLSSLTRLPSSSLNHDAVPYLSLFPGLRSLKFEIFHKPKKTSFAGVRVYSPWVSAEELRVDKRLRFSPTESSDLCHLLACPSLPNLRQLELCFLVAPVDDFLSTLCGLVAQNLLVLSMHAVDLPNLQFLAQIPQLQQLGLSECSEKLCIEDMTECIPAISRSLRHLHITERARSLVSTTVQAAMRVPSTLLPLLLCFRYAHAAGRRGDFTHLSGPCEQSPAFNNGADATTRCCLPIEEDAEDEDENEEEQEEEGHDEEEEEEEKEK